MKRVHIKTQVGALSGPDCGITEHGRKPNFLRPLSKPLFDQEAMPRRVRESGLEILGPVKAGKNKGRYVMRPCPACIYLGKPRRVR